MPATPVPSAGPCPGRDGVSSPTFSAAPASGHCASTDTSPPLVFTAPPPCITQPQAQRRSVAAAVGAWGAPTPRFHVALDQGAGSVSLWLINVQFEVYYEPPGFNYCTIIQSIPCHFIFMAFVMPPYVRSPHSVLEEFPSSAGFYTVLLAGPDCRLFRPPVCAFHSEFFTDLTPCALFLSFSWDTAVFLSSETVL